MAQAMCCTFADTMRFAVLMFVACLACSSVRPRADEPIPSSPPGPPGPDDNADEASKTVDPAPQAETPPPPPPPKTGELLQITVVSADIRGRMANEEHWDGERGTGKVQQPIVRYLALHPELQDTAKVLGVPVDQDDFVERARSSPAADPMVVVEVDDLVFRSPAEPRAFNPLWDFSFRFLHGELNGRKGVQRGAMVRIHVLDYDGPDHFDAIGSTVLSVDQLQGKPVHELGPFGGVNKLTLQVRTLEPPTEGEEATSTRLAVPGKPSWTDTGIDLVAGQRVEISAADEVCTTPEGDKSCSGPEGQSRPSSYNLRGFEAIGHGALVAAIGDTRFVVRRGLAFVAPSSGRLRLGVNDHGSYNNRGSYAVHVVVHAMP